MVNSQVAERRTTSRQIPARHFVRTDETVRLSGVAKRRWAIERDYEELKQELGLGHVEGSGWRGSHHHATLCFAAYGFLIAERNRISPPVALDCSDLPYPDFLRIGNHAERAEQHNPYSVSSSRDAYYDASP
ncbi:MAG: transposase [Bryobacterales bacterium]|nr:transposase [Bryobacterales bacterium]